ncbi:MAG TPA: phosphotransferase, partial [Nitriliruptorales bacterium]
TATVRVLMGAPEDFDRDAWLRRYQRDWNAPDAVIDAAIRTATGRGVVERTRLYIGEANETHVATVVGGRQVLVKIAHGRPDSFANLARMSALAGGAGVAVPEVLHAAIVDLEKGPSGLVVQTYLAGQPLVGSIADLAPGDIERFVVEAGRILARLHAISLPDFDRTGGPASSEVPRSFSEDILPMLVHGVLPRLEAAADHHGMLPRVREARAVIEERAHELDRWGPVVTHGDYGLDHLLVEGGRITGLIDLDLAAASSPLRDIGWWDHYFDRPPHPSSLLIAGYRQVGELPDDPAPRRLYAVVMSLATLDYFLSVDNPGGVEFSRRKLDGALASRGPRSIASGVRRGRTGRGS